MKTVTFAVGVNGDEKPPEFGEERKGAPDSFARG
jgi:hypothetical protein